MKEYCKTIVVDRTGWPNGPWDQELDYYEWTTQAGYEAYLFRLPTGAWAANIIAPYPTDTMMLSAFCHTLWEKRFYELEYQTGMISKTDVEGIGEHGASWEHWAAPGKKTKSRGPYKNLEEVKQICEVIAQDIFEVWSSKNYENYFDLTR